MQFTLEHATETERGSRDIAIPFFLTLALDGCWWLTSSPGPGVTRYPLHRKVGGPQGRSGRLRKILPPTGFLSPVPLARSELLHQLSYPGLS